MLSQGIDQMNFSIPARKVYDEPQYINLIPVIRTSNDHFVQLCSSTISDHSERMQRSVFDSTPHLWENTTPYSSPSFGGNQYHNQQIHCQNYSYITGPNNGNLIGTFGSTPPNNVAFNVYYTSSQSDDSRGSSETNSVLPIQAFLNNQGGNMWPISYINPNTYHNNVQYPVENVPFAQNVKPESISSVYQSNPMYINEGYPYECSAHPQHFSNGKNSQGLICTTCSNTNNDPYYRSDLKMYICRFCGGGFSENNLQNQATSKPLKYMDSNKIEHECSNCRTNTTSVWRRSNKRERICNACALYFKMHGTNRPLLMKKDIIKKRNRTCSQMVRLRESKVETRNRTQVQKLAGEFQSENISYQGHGCSNNQTQTNSAF